MAKRLKPVTLSMARKDVETLLACLAREPKEPLAAEEAVIVGAVRDSLSRALVIQAAAPVTGRLPAHYPKMQLPDDGAPAPKPKPAEPAKPRFVWPA